MDESAGNDQNFFQELYRLIVMSKYLLLDNIQMSLANNQ